jgi:hypothetical protein
MIRERGGGSNFRMVLAKGQKIQGIVGQGKDCFLL